MSVLVATDTPAPARNGRKGRGNWFGRFGDMRRVNAGRYRAIGCVPRAHASSEITTFRRGKRHGVSRIERDGDGGDERRG